MRLPVFLKSAPVFFAIPFSMFAAAEECKTSEVMLVEKTGWDASEDNPRCADFRFNSVNMPLGTSSCARPCVLIPKGEITRVDVSTSPGDIKGKWELWWSTPEVYEHGDRQNVCGNYKNWNSGVDRRVTITACWK